MLKNYLKVAIRNLIKNKAYSAINILGLALGLHFTPDNGKNRGQRMAMLLGFGNLLIVAAAFYLLSAAFRRGQAAAPAPLAA